MTGRMPDPAELDRMEHPQEYPRWFSEADFWRPWVELACRQSFGRAPGTVRSGLPGTYPTFIAGERWVVKLFGRLFDGELAFCTEKQAAALLRGAAEIPAARLLASGCLLEAGAGWRWPYLVFEFVPGESLGAAWERLGQAGHLPLASEIGGVLRRLHSLPLEGGPADAACPQPVFLPSWAPYLDFLRRQRRGCLERCQGLLPPRLLAQLDSYLLPPEALLDPGPPHLIHADLTRDHLLGRLESGRWQTLAWIDFGDARAGSLPYELAALHVDLFRLDRRLLDACLEAYGLDAAARAALPRRALSALLLHQFSRDLLAATFELRPELRALPGLEDLAQAMFAS